jgi:hypothetical protein
MVDRSACPVPYEVKGERVIQEAEGRSKKIK